VPVSRRATIIHEALIVPSYLTDVKVNIERLGLRFYTPSMESWLNLLVDPIDRLPLRTDGRELVAASGKRYPIVEGIPLLLHADLPPTHRSSNRTIKFAAIAKRGEPVE
jgi:uncharacterized protein YbaR (Trm112 family)